MIADEPATRFRLVSPRDDGILATGLNGRGDVVGFQWLEEKDQPGVVSQMPFFARGKNMIMLPLLPGYTATHPAAISDTGLVVGRASKPAPPAKRVNLRNQAFIWDGNDGIRGIGALTDDSASYACGVTRDGSRICGVTVGDNRVRACVWDRAGDQWTGTALPQVGMLGSQVVKISDDGRYVASIDGAVPCLWTRQDGDRGPANRSAMPARSRPACRQQFRHGRRPSLQQRVFARCRDLDARAGFTRFEYPKGYVPAEAHAINNAGVVVGMVDGPHGSSVGPSAFVYEKGRFRVIDEFGPAFTSANAINDAGQVAGDLDKEEVAGADAGGHVPAKTSTPGKPAQPARPR